MDLRTVAANFESKTYSLRRVPRFLQIDPKGVHLHKDGRNQDEIKSQENLDWTRDRVITPKLKGSSYGGYYFDIGMISTKYFESKEKLDSLYANECWSDAEPGDSETPIQKEKISLDEAVKLLTVTISCSMDYYLANRDEMEKDLGKKVDSLDLNDKNVLTQLEKELLYNQMTTIFGDDNDENGEIILTDFHILFLDGNHAFATARRGNFYWIFYYCTS